MVSSYISRFENTTSHERPSVCQRTFNAVTGGLTHANNRARQTLDAVWIAPDTYNPGNTQFLYVMFCHFDFICCFLFSFLVELKLRTAANQLCITARNRSITAYMHQRTFTAWQPCLLSCHLSTEWHNCVWGHLVKHRTTDRNIRIRSPHTQLKLLQNEICTRTVLSVLYTGHVKKLCFFMCGGCFSTLHYRSLTVCMPRHRMGKSQCVDINALYTTLCMSVSISFQGDGGAGLRPVLDQHPVWPPRPFRLRHASRYGKV